MYKFKEISGYFNECLPMKKWNGIDCVDNKGLVGMTLSGIYENFEFKDLKVLEYISDKQPKLRISYNNKNVTMHCSQFLRGGLGKLFGVVTKEFRFEVGQTFKDDKRDLVIINREYRQRKFIDKEGYNCIQNQKWYKYACNKCGWKEGWIEEHHLKSGKGCACCGKQVTVLGINTVWDTDRWIVDLGVSEEDAKKYSRCSDERITVTCPDCGKKKIIVVKNVYRNKSIGCVCRDGASYISKYVVSVLDQLQIEYQTEVKYDWNKYVNPKNNKLAQASIDFVIYKNNREIPLEADGAFHRSYNKMTGMTVEMHQHIDQQRDENCLKYLGEETIRISDEGDVKENILNSKLAVEFDLSNIDWVEAEMFAIKSNIVKEVCDYWNNKQEWETTYTIAESNIFKTRKPGTIINYLKKGAKLGWCDYDPKEQLRKGAIKAANTRKATSSKSIEIFKDGKSLGIFESAIELERKSEKLFGTKLHHPNISAVCLGRKKQYKGFTFEHTEKQK